MQMCLYGAWHPIVRRKKMLKRGVFNRQNHGKGKRGHHGTIVVFGGLIAAALIVTLFL